MNKAQENWKKTYKKGKAPLSWNLNDYKVWNEEPPICVFNGITEGEIMETEDIEQWFLETTRTLSVFAQEYPEKIEQQYQLYLFDLEYLKKLGKIDTEIKEKMSSKENFSFGK